MLLHTYNNFFAWVGVFHYNGDFLCAVKD